MDEREVGKLQFSVERKFAYRGVLLYKLGMEKEGSDKGF